MKILFVHNNFPAQFGPVARALVRDPEVEVAAIGSMTSRAIQGVNLVKYRMPPGDVSQTHPFARRFDVECRRAEQVLYGLSSLIASGFVPDIIVAHPGWGETLPLRSAFPRAQFLLYCEFFYGTEGRDVGFDPEFPSTGLDGDVALKLKNAATLLALSDCDRALSPTQWQRATFPKHFQSKIDVIHEGIDTDVARPNPEASFDLGSGKRLTRADQVVTFVARNLEPMRGYHVFMRTLPEILARLPAAHLLIIGGDGTSYGARPPEGETWKSIFLSEVADKIDHTRVHFTGRLPHRQFIRALQVSSAHIYLTYPFVLSWSVLEAMSCGCVVIGSDTPPVRELIDGNNGILVPFFDRRELAGRVVEVVRDAQKFHPMRRHARQYVLDRYDSERVGVPRTLELLRACMGWRDAGGSATATAGAAALKLPSVAAR
jgi:glycosyltransferase involved in cell wall biosynthesis